MHRVQKLLSNYGYCSRRKAEELIQDGRVKINGKLITIGDKASENDEISVDGEVVNKERRVYLIFNKPTKCVTALRDERHKTVMDYIKSQERIFPIGRLDYNTSGMLLLTNDGDFANKVMHPRNEIDKTYLARVDKEISKEDIKHLESGIFLDGKKTSKAKVTLHDQKLIEITIHEGRNRIVRRMLAKLKYKVLGLERISIGKLGIGNLQSGKYKNLNKKEIDKIFM